MAYRCILLFGEPGSGKGVQGAALGALPGFVHLSTGDMFRHLDRDSEIGRTVHEYASQGKLVPDDLTVTLWRQHVQGLADRDAFRPDRDILILDGIPRNVDQARMMEDHIDVLRLIHLVAGDEEAILNRLKGRALQENRLDDADEAVIRRRRRIYLQESKPVVECYPREVRREIDALRTPSEVLADVARSVTDL